MSDRVPATFADVRALRDDFVDFAEELRAEIRELRAEIRAEAGRERAARDLESKRLERILVEAIEHKREWKAAVKNQLLEQNRHFERLKLASHAGPVPVVVEPTKFGITVATWRTAFVALIVFVVLSPLVACAGYGVARAVTDAGTPAREAQR